MKIDLSNLRRSVNDAFWPALFATQRYEVLYGGAGSGKSQFAAQKIITRCLLERNHRFLILRKFACSHRESTHQMLVSIIESWKLLNRVFKVRKSDLSIISPSLNCEIIFAGLDDVEKL
jgi:phage terminase large subunit